MVQLRRILAATDFSPRANMAVRRAARVAHEHRAALHLLHVAKPRPTIALAGGGGARSDAAHERGQGNAESKLRAVAGLLHSHFGIDVAFEIRLGQPHEEIAEHAHQCDVDLIVVGAHGEHFIADLLLGATASRLVRLTAKPVLVARLQPTDGYTRTLVGVDFSPSSRSALRYARSLGPSAVIWACHVLETESERARRDEAMTRLRQFVQEESPAAPFTLMVEEGYPPQIICEKIARVPTGLICIGKHGLYETNPRLLGGVAKHVLEGAPCDVALLSA